LRLSLFVDFFVSFPVAFEATLQGNASDRLRRFPAAFEWLFVPSAREWVAV